MTLVAAARRTIRRVIDPVRTVPIDRCYHYRGFRYGGFGNNLYEDYIVAFSNRPLHLGRRADFAEALLRCRPKTLDEALHLRLGDAALWEFPWAPRSLAPISPVGDPHDNPDPVCHYCEAGILASQINREIGWLERAFDSIRSVGYQPETYGFISLIELVGETGSTYIVLDGNHRISALHAAGETSIRAKVSSWSRVHRTRAKTWPGVVDGRFGVDTALAVFDRYAASSNPALEPLHPAPLIVDEPPLWRAEPT